MQALSEWCVSSPHIDLLTSSLEFVISLNYRCQQDGLVNPAHRVTIFASTLQYFLMNLVGFVAQTICKLAVSWSTNSVQQAG